MARTADVPEAVPVGALSALLRPSLARLTDGPPGIAQRRSATEASRLDRARYLFKRTWTAVAFFWAAAMSDCLRPSRVC
jgi:hypothetical protein